MYKHLREFYIYSCFAVSYTGKQTNRYVAHKKRIWLFLPVVCDEIVVVRHVSSYYVRRQLVHHWLDFSNLMIDYGTNIAQKHSRQHYCLECFCAFFSSFVCLPVIRYMFVE